MVSVPKYRQIVIARSLETSVDQVPENPDLRPLRLPLSKVATDKVVSGLLLVLSFPVSLLIIVSIKFENLFKPERRGGIFHIERRVSAGQPFDLYKFRILKPSGEQAIKEGRVPKDVENDRNQLTTVGKLLKKIGLDELPQLAMVLDGSMSLVGPRPKPADEYEAELARGNIFRAKLRAGLTGPAQVQKGTVRGPDDGIRADFAYMELVRDGSPASVLMYDLKIMAKTVRVLLRATGE